ncbi:MAG TPA: tryptophan--tRNA ligase [Candidatus Ruthenibacterium merdigallinarum]|nr:tryptophan--tRNA ligase [Candidatus Ruthenibacterium merdigallinarum]
MQQQEKTARRQRVFSGIQPTGTFTLGNYVGAVRNWPRLQQEYDCIYSVVDEHAITVRQDPAALRRQTRETAALLLASGIDPEKSIVFVQSHVPAHAQLSWVLGCFCPFGDLTRMHQFKEKSKKHPEDINGGLLTYPILMAADILVYGTDLVPIGIDQKQHLELARNIAQRFNGIYGDTFTVPDGYFPTVGAKVMSLQEPEKKMSKSDTNANAVIRMLDDADTIVRKFRRAVTDSDNCVRAGADKPGVTNLMSIYSAMTGRGFAAIEAEFAGRGYGEFKQAVAESVVDSLRPIQQEYARILADRAYLDGVLKDGAERAAHIARRVLDKTYRKVGFLQL